MYVVSNTIFALLLHTIIYFNQSMFASLGYVQIGNFCHWQTDKQQHNLGLLRSLQALSNKNHSKTNEFHRIKVQQ